MQASAATTAAPPTAPAPAEAAAADDVASPRGLRVEQVCLDWSQMFCPPPGVRLRTTWYNMSTLKCVVLFSTQLSLFRKDTILDFILSSELSYIYMNSY